MRADECVLCGAGRYADDGPGQYQVPGGSDNFSGEVCKPCAAGRYSLSGLGQTSVLVCRACEAGRYQDTPGSHKSCTECIGGRYSDAGPAQVSEASCKLCPVNTWMLPTAGKGHNDSRFCLACKFGRHSDPGLLAEDCKFDYFVVLVPVLGSILTLLVFIGLKVFKRKVWNVACRPSNAIDKESSAFAAWQSTKRREFRPSPARTVVLMKQAKKKKEKRPRPVAVKPELTFEERFVPEVI